MKKEWMRRRYCCRSLYTFGNNARILRESAMNGQLGGEERTNCKAPMQGCPANSGES